MSTTPILGLPLPTVGGDFDTWGTKLLTGISITDFLGAGAVVNASANVLVIAGVFPEAFYRITTAGLTVTVTLPAPGTITAGKLFTVKKVDAGLGVAAVIVAGAGTIDNVLEWDLTNQYAFVRVLNNGVGYDVVGTG